MPSSLRLSLRHRLAAGCAVVAALLTLAACDHVDIDERYIAVERQQPVTPPDSDSTAVLSQYRRVLIEDFTGQRCVNCPNAAAEIERLQAAYGSDTVIAVSIHGGELAFAGNARNIGLRTDLGDEYNNRWNVKAWPKGMVNRSGTLTDYEEWFTLVHNALQLEAPLALTITDIALATTTDEQPATLVVSTTLEGLSDVSGSLQLWLTESNIVAMQSMPDGTTNREYVHNHVLRAAINGTWGEPVTLAKGQTQSFTHTVALDPTWQTDHLAVVAFVYNDQGVQQVTESHQP